MTNFTYFPKNVFKGTNSDGSTFRVNEWDYGTLAQVELFSFLAMLFGAFIFSAVAGPIITIFAIIYFNGRFKPACVVALISSTYFVCDALYGWLGLSILNLFFSEETISLMVAANVATVVISIFIIFFSPILYHWLSTPFRGYTERQLASLGSDVKAKKSFQIIINLIVYALIICLLATLSFNWANSRTNHTGWVSTNLATQ